jgi:copper chaperone
VETDGFVIAEAFMATVVKIEGMSCTHCVNAVRAALSALKGVRDVNVDLATGQASFAHDEDLDMDTVRDVVEKTGYRVG